MTLSVQAGTPLPLENPGFENGPGGWQITEPDEKMSSVIPEAAHEGSSGLRVSDNSNTLSARVVSSKFPVTPGKTYRLTYWARTSTPARAGVFFRFIKANNVMFPESHRPFSNIDEKDSDWKQYTLDVIAPEEAVEGVLWIHSYSTAQGEMDLDDFALEEMEGDPVTPPQAPSSTQTSSQAAPAAAAAPAKAVAAVPRTSPARIIIKADDLRTDNKGRIHARWQKFIDEIKQRGIKASIGIICNSLEGDQPEYFKTIKDLHAGGQFEFWNHGYDHLEWAEGDKKVFEFQGSGYDHQKKNFTRSNELAKEKLGIVFQTFGPPFNATDADTVKVLSEAPETRIWLYGDIKGQNAGKLVLDRLWDVNIEKPLFSPNSQAFIEGYRKHPGRDCFIIQGHPSRWDDERFAEFQKILDFLTEEKAVFITPSEYQQTQLAQSPQP